MLNLHENEGHIVDGHILQNGPDINFLDSVGLILGTICFFVFGCANRKCKLVKEPNKERFACMTYRRRIVIMLRKGGKCTQLAGFSARRIKGTMNAKDSLVSLAAQREIVSFIVLFPTELTASVWNCRKSILVKPLSSSSLLSKNPGKGGIVSWRGGEELQQCTNITNSLQYIPLNCCNT